MIAELYSGYHTETGRAFQEKGSAWAESWRHMSLVRERGVGKNGDTNTWRGLSISCRLCPGAWGTGREGGMASSVILGLTLATSQEWTMDGKG